MKIYKCIVSYRYYGNNNGPVLYKVFFIKADSPVTAFVKAQQETKNLYNVYPPEIKELVMPNIDFVYSKEEIIREYGTIAFKEAEEKLRYATINKTKDGSRDEY